MLFHTGGLLTTSFSLTPILIMYAKLKLFHRTRLMYNNYKEKLVSIFKTVPVWSYFVL